MADAPSGNWVYRVLPRTLWPYAQLARWDRPIGWQLLMWPCWWSAALAADVEAGLGTLHWGRFAWHLALFMIGAIAMRGAGCTYNDLVDHRIDASVARTRSRPLPSGRVRRWQAKLFIGLQALVGLLVLLQFNRFAVGLGVFSLGVRRRLSLRQALHRLAAILSRPCLFLGRDHGLGGRLRRARRRRRWSSMPARSSGRSATTRSMRIRTRRTTRWSAFGRPRCSSAPTRSAG